MSKLHRVSCLGIAVFMLNQPVLAETTTFECNYETFSSRDGLHSYEEPFVLTFLIDSATEKAYMIGNAGSTEVSIIAHEGGGFTTIEITKTGNVMVTVITPDGTSVHSRGTIMFGDIVPTQSYGTCESKELGR